MNKDQFKGRVRQAKGKLKEVTGRLFGNKTLEGRGRVTKTGGRIQTGYGDMKDQAQKPE